MAKKKRSQRAGAAKGKRKPVPRNQKQKQNLKKKTAKKEKKKVFSKKALKIKAVPGKTTAAHNPYHHLTTEELNSEIQKRAQDLFVPSSKKNWKFFVKRYSPVLVTMVIGIITYSYLIFFLFYPQLILQGRYLQLFGVLMFIFLIIGLLIHLGMRSELMFIRILSFLFVFVLFTFLLLFILLAHSMTGTV